jgi:DNA-binding XRE family transcriptional regulator/mannose-6-phosphate isomerase-like protein (cupin superfamily)
MLSRGKVMNTLGDTIRSFRKNQGRTIQELSAATKLSAAFISRMERGEINPSIASIMKIARALGISVADLFQDADAPEAEARSGTGTPAAGTHASGHAPAHAPTLEVVHRERRRQLVYPGLNFSEYLLTASMRNVGIEFLYHVSEPGATSGEEYYSHTGEECILVLKGELSLWVEDRELCLKEGDSVHFRSELPHHWENRGRATVEAVWVVVPPTY